MTTETTRTTQEWANEIIDTWCEGVKDGFEPFSAICGIIEAIKAGGYECQILKNTPKPREYADEIARKVGEKICEVFHSTVGYDAQHEICEEATPIICKAINNALEEAANEIDCGGCYGTEINNGGCKKLSRMSPCYG